MLTSSLKAPPPPQAGSAHGTELLLVRLQQAIAQSKPPVQAWLAAQIEAALAQIPFLEVSLRDIASPSPEPDQLLTAQQAGKIADVHARWFYRHAKQLPFSRRLSRKVLRFSETGLRHWLATRKP